MDELNVLRCCRPHSLYHPYFSLFIENNAMRQGDTLTQKISHYYEMLYQFHMVHETYSV